MKPNPTQIDAAKAVMKQYAATYGATATDLHQNTAVMAIYAIILGKIAAVPAEYKQLTNNIELSIDNPNLQPGDPVDIPVDAPAGDTVLVATDEYERTMAILSGLTFDREQLNLTISEDAAVLLRDPEDATPFPEAGIYITYVSAARMVEQVMRDATDPDTIIGKQVLESLTDPAQADDTDDEDDVVNGSDDSDPKIDFDPMTVAQLREFAKNNDIDVSDMNKKADIIAGLREHGF